MKAQAPVHIRDPIHGTIVLTGDELAVLENPVCQRLRGIKQLGFTDHAFPGATHSRFTHSLGAMEIAGRMFDAIFPPDGDGSLTIAERRRFRQLVRLALLLHDIGHAPLSHATEASMPTREELGLSCFSPAERSMQAKHEDFTIFLILRSDLADTLRRTFGGQGIEPEDVAQLISGRFPERAATFTIGGVDYGPLLAQIVSGELDADRMDYLQRDSYYTGVNYGKYDQQWLIDNLTHHVEGGRAHLALTHRAVFAFEDFLLSRYHMFVSVYYHHASIGFDTMLARFIEEEPRAFEIPVSAEEYVRFDDVAFWSILRASDNRWAQRVVRRDLYRRIVELNAEEELPDVKGLEAALDEAGVDYFISRDEGVLSRYYRGVSPSIFVINRALQRVTRIDTYSKLFERYAQPAKLIRVYCRPDQVQQGRHCLAAFLRRPQWQQLRLDWALV